MENASRTQQDYEKRILRVLVHIQDRLDHALDLDELAAVACFSQYHFHRIFRGMVGEPVKGHIRRLRLERAAHRLKTTGRPVTEIAFEAGYDTHEAFTRAFRSHFAMSPSEYREASRATAIPESPSGVHYEPESSLASFRAVAGGEGLHKVRLERIEPFRVAFVRHVGPYSEVGQAWQRLMAWAGPKGLFMVPQLRIVGVVHDDPEITPPEKLRYDAGVQVASQIEGEGDIGIQQIPAGAYAVATHRGPYDTVGEAYAMILGQWMPANGYEPVGQFCFEVYLNNPQVTPPEDLLTDIYVPLVLDA